MLTVRTLLQRAPVIPVLTIDDVAHAVPLAEALVAGGLPVLEVTLRTPAALGAIRAMEEGDLAARAAAIGDLMLPRLRAMAEQHPSIGDVRGRGAMTAVEIVRPGTLEPDADTAAKVARFCHNEGVVVLTAGTYGNVLRFLPPLTISDDLLDEALTVLEKAFASVAG